MLLRDRADRPASPRTRNRRQAATAARPLRRRRWSSSPVVARRLLAPPLRTCPRIPFPALPERHTAKRIAESLVAGPSRRLADPPAAEAVLGSPSTRCPCIRRSHRFVRSPAPADRDSSRQDRTFALLAPR